MAFALDHYRLLGRSGLRVSPLSLGTMTFRNDSGWGSTDEEARRIFDIYVERGGNFVDTANFYGRGGSETLTGELIGPRRDRLVLSSKYSLSMFPGDPNASGNHRKNMVQSVEASLRRLGTDYIDLLYLHVWDDLTPIEEIMRAFDDLVRSGKVLYAGISDTPAWQIARMQTLAELRGWTPLVALQIPYSLAERTVEPELMAMARRLGLGVAPWSPLAGGVLTGKYKREDLDTVVPAPGEVNSRKEINVNSGRLNARTFEIIDAVKAVADEQSATMSQVALAWTLLHPSVASPIIGARTPEQLEDNLGALSIAFDESQIARLDAVSKVPAPFPFGFLNSPMRDFMFGDVKVRQGVSAVIASGSETPFPPRTQAWAAVFLLMVLYLTSILDRNIIALLGDTIRHDLHLDDRELSLLFGPAYAVSYAIGALPLGWAMDRFSRRWVLWAGVTAWSLGTMAGGISRSFTQMFAARALVGAGEAVLVPGNQSVIADMFPPDRMALPFAVCSMGVKLGQGFSFLIGGALIALIAPAALYATPLAGELSGWQLILIVMGAPGLLIALLVFLIPEPARRGVRTEATNTVGYRDYLAYAWRHRRFFISVHLAGILAVIVHSSMMVWAPAHFIRAHGMPTAQVGLWLGLAVSIGPVLGLLAHGIASDWLFRRGAADAHGRYLAWMVGLGAIPLASAFLVPSPWLGFALIGLGDSLFGAFGMLGPTIIQMMLPGKMRGKAASGLLLVTSLFGMAVGPTLVATLSESVLADPNSIGPALALCIGVALPGAALLYALTLQPLRRAYGGSSELSALHADPSSA